MERGDGQVAPDVAPAPGEDRRVGDPHEVEAAGLDLGGIGAGILGFAHGGDAEAELNVHGLRLPKS